MILMGDFINEIKSKFQAGMNSEYVAGTLAIALCPFGTIIQGPVTSLCADGQWSTTFANCKASF